MLPTLSTLAHSEMQSHAGGAHGAGTGDAETESICEYLVAHKSRLAKEHRDKQEDEWFDNKHRISSYLEAFRAKKRALARTGRVAEDSLSGGGTRHKTASARSSSSGSSSSCTPASQHGAGGAGAGAGARGEGADAAMADEAMASGRVVFSYSSVFVSQEQEAPRREKHEGGEQQEGATEGVGGGSNKGAHGERAGCGNGSSARTHQGGQRPMLPVDISPDGCSAVVQDSVDVSPHSCTRLLLPSPSSSLLLLLLSSPSLCSAGTNNVLPELPSKLQN